MFGLEYQSRMHDSGFEASDNDAESDDRSPEQTMAAVDGMSPRSSAANMSKRKIDSVYGTLRAREMGMTPHRVYLSACQDTMLRLFNKSSILANKKTSFPCHGLDGDYKSTGQGSRSKPDIVREIARETPYDEPECNALPYKEVSGRDIGWSIIDTSFDPDYNFLTLDEQESEGAICFFSLQFSQDAKEIIAGANDGHIYLYDVERDKRVYRFKGHDDDINAVTFLDNKCNIIFSGSDDSLIKVWDRRMLQNENCEAIGILAGHSEGITHLHSRNDGRYVISNCKDDTIRLWDMRKLRSPQQENELRQCSTYDYRHYRAVRPRAGRPRSSVDDSIQVYTEHTVRGTLIRAYFSPIESTGGEGN